MRYTAIAVVLMGSYALSGCDGYTDEKVDVYTSVQECLQNNPNDKGQCNSDYLTAQKASSLTAPKYSSKQDCDEEFGADRCIQNTSTGSTGSTSSGSSMMMWYPMMSGFTRNSSYAAQPLYSSHQPASPMYNKFVDAKGNSFGYMFNPGTTRTVPSSYMGPKPSTTSTTTRGGFGSSVRSAAMSVSSSHTSSGGHSFSSSSRGGSFGG